MLGISIIVGSVLGILIGVNLPIISYTYSSYLAIAIIAALDTIFGGVRSVIDKQFNLTIFITGFFGNGLLAILLTLLGQKLNVDIYLAAIVVFVYRIFNNLGFIRRYYLEVLYSKLKKLDLKKVKKSPEKTK